jgi:hypothetical protein
MHDTITERGGADPAGLALVNRERTVGTGTVGFAGKLLVQPEQLAFEIEDEAGNAGREANVTDDFQYDVPSASRLALPQTQSPSTVQRMIYYQMGSGKRFLGPTRLRRVRVFGNTTVFPHVHSYIKRREW